MTATSLPTTRPPLPAVQSPEEAAQTVSSWWNNPITQSWLVERPINVGIILVAAIIGHWLLRYVIARVARQAISSGGLSKARVPQINFGWDMLRPSSAKAKQDDAQAQMAALEKAHEERRVSRINTLSSVAKSAAGIFVWAWAALAILSELGVNVAPLIASAGVAGVALGFGAQSLVKDFLSGIFMLLEDQYGIGDTVDLGNGVVGTVEAISLRITTVRDIDGALWYVRNGEILSVANHTDEYSIARIQVPVGLSNNVEDAERVIKSAVLNAAEDDEIAGHILDEPTVQGITEWAPDYVSIRATIKTLPGSQWKVQRFVQARVWAQMQAHHIATPYPHGKGITNHEPA